MAVVAFGERVTPTQIASTAAIFLDVPVNSRLMLIITLRFWWKRIEGMKILMAQDGLTGWRVNWGITKYLLGKPGILRRIAPAWAKYFLPGFHPWNEDDRALIARWDSDYAAARMPGSELAAAA